MKKDRSNTHHYFLNSIIPAAMAKHAHFDNIYRGLDNGAGRLRLQEGGLGWKPASAEAGSSTFTLEAEKMEAFAWLKVARGYQLRITTKDHDKRKEIFDGFHRDDLDHLASALSEYFHKRLDQVEVSVRGWNWGKALVEDSEVRFLVRDKLAFELPVEQIANSNIAGKTEVSMEFITGEQQQPETNTGASANGAGKAKKQKGDQLVEMRLHVPGNARKEDDDDEQSGEEEEEETAASAFHEAIKAKADIGQAAGDGIILFKEVLVLTPRGRYDLDMFSTFLRLRGKTYDYKVLYSSITRLFLLPKPDEIHVQFVVGLDPPIRQGQTRYPYLVLQFVREEELDAELNLDEETIQTKYEGKLKRRYEDPTFRIVSSLFRVFSGQKLIAPGNDSFEAANASSCLKCNVKAVDGLLYPLDKQLIWVSKQPIHIRYDDIHQVVFSRVGAGGAVSTSKTFDLKVVQRNGAQTIFAAVNREEFDALSQHFTNRKVRVKNEMAEVVAIDDVLSDDDEDEEMEDEDDGSRRRRKASAKDADVVMDEDEDSEEDQDFEAESSDGGSPSEASSDESGAETGSDDMADGPPKKKKKAAK
jgi:structure-specific recognition protein 1